MQAAVLQDQPALFQGAVQAAQQALGAEGLFQEVIGAGAHGLHRHRHVTMAREQDHRQVGILLLELFQQLQATHAGHAHVADDHAWEMPGQLRQTVFGSAEQLDLEARQAEPLLHGAADTGFVVDDDD
ncbi:hypothetical protein D3C85_1272120 [compost metagenome]